MKSDLIVGALLRGTGGIHSKKQRVLEKDMSLETRRTHVAGQTGTGRDDPLVKNVFDVTLRGGN